MQEEHGAHRTGGHFRQGHEHDGSLADLLDRCGHYYVHRIDGGHRGQEGVLAWLREHPDVTQKEIGEGLGMLPAALSELLMKLERKGHIVRFKDPQDRRFSRVRLTEAGETALGEGNEPEDPFAGLTAQEQEELKGLLTKLLADWEKRYISRRKQRGERLHGEHGNEHPGHGEEHPGHGRGGERGTRGHGRGTDRRGHGRR